MNLAFLLQLAVSATAVGLMIGLAAWATRGRAAPGLDEATARRCLADEFPGRKIDCLWIATDGLAALAKSGDRALILTRMGDGYAARQIDWAQALAARAEDGRVRIALPDITAPNAVLALGAWPPKDLAA